MTEFSFQNTKNEKTNSSNITTISSYFLSHKLYFSYLIFFFPYLFKLISFLSPLFFTTFLLFLSLVTTLIPLRSFIKSKDEFFLTACDIIIEHFRPCFDNVENDKNSLYKVVFDIPEIELCESNPVEENKFGENPDEETCQMEDQNCRILISEQETSDKKPEKMEEIKGKIQEETVKRSESKINEVNKTPKFGSLKSKNDEKFFDAFQQTPGVQQNLASFGSMRKEKEWRRTLACKLFEERHNWSNKNININNINNNNVIHENGEEVMDLLWETNDVIIDTNKGKIKKQENEKKEKTKYNNNNYNNKNNNSNKKIEELMKNESVNLGSEDCEEYESGKICCLQAFKLSASKMNLSMGSGNLAKFSKAFKGIGWLQTHVKRKGKKGYK